jgi:uncharacterized protein (TIGR03067 family)
MACRIAAFAVAIVSGTFGAPLTADDKKEDGHELQGTWAYQSMEWDGKQLPAAQISTTTITFEKDKFTVKVGGKVTMAGTFKLDPAKSPKTFGAIVAEGPGKGSEPLGIYKLDGDTLTGCVKLTGRERPTEFKSKEASDTVIVVAKRVKK